MQSTSAKKRQEHSAIVLVGLLLLFGLRVTGQILVVFWQVRYLPPLREWQSGLLPYPMLLLSQMFIIGLFSKVCIDLWQERGYFAQNHPRLGTALLNFGRLYFVSMVLRYIIWMILSPEARWFGGCIPIVFHCVLATFLMILGSYYRRRACKESEPAKTERRLYRQSFSAGRLVLCTAVTWQFCQPVSAAPQFDLIPLLTVQVEHNVACETADGIRLLADVFQPASSESKHRLRSKPSFSNHFADCAVIPISSKQYKRLR